MEAGVFSLGRILPLGGPLRKQKIKYLERKRAVGAEICQ